MNESQPNYIVPGSESKKLQMQPFYVVSTLKFWLLSIGTLGFFHFAWFILNWKRIAKSNIKVKEPSIFAKIISTLFFVHALFLNIDNTLRERLIVHAWRPRLLATIYVILVLINITGMFVTIETNWFASFPFWLPKLCSLTLISAVLFRAQRAINLACDDPKGQTNRKITWWNILVSLLVFTAPIATVDVSVELPASKTDTVN
ncbi:MAG: hypothetical protein FD163_2562 [Hyphomonadaceae bacterium]|nr:MAG: hypothetical protein FD128_2268 [Hyphomonadaceae bacterium]KAF0182419.1 MAG: hypothetical protein FD163_2562 [Hyphomonadaceae bacterium]